MLMSALEPLCFTSPNLLRKRRWIWDYRSGTAGNSCNVGGGFKYLIQDQFAVTVDLKDRVSLVPSYGIPVSATVVGSQYQPGMSLHGLMHNWQLNFGVTFQWDEW